MIIEIGNIPPSLNKSLTIGRVGRFYRLIHTKEAREYQKQALESTGLALEEMIRRDSAFLRHLKDMVGRELIMSIVFTSVWYNKTNCKDIKHRDLCNLEKLLTDTLFKSIKVYVPELDDSQIFEINMKKEKGTEDRTKVQIEILK
jgi:Holliday junction resolvase RusA-like endonuclease